MIREIEVRNFQSLRSLEVRLGRFTVIVGPSSAGKSAFIRAVRLLVFNARGTSFITRGEKQCIVGMLGAADDEVPWAADIRRGAKDAYRTQVGDEVKNYTKLAGKVPDEVSALLRLGDINFAGQFVPPYLLDASGGEVARVLGRLTNVTLLHKAAQEANRRRLQAAALLKIRQADLASLAEQAAQYATLKEEGEVVTAAEAHLGMLDVLAERRRRLGQLGADYGLAWRKLHGLRACPEPPSLALLEELNGKILRLRYLAGRCDDLNLALRAKVQQERDAAAAAESCQRELDSYTAQWGVCPACGQPVRKDHAHA